MDLIHLDDIAFPAIIGMYAQEREREQPLHVELSLGLSLEGAADGDFTQTVDYHGILHDVRFVAQQGHFHMLESLGCALVRLLLRPPGPGEQRATVQQATVGLRKPRALGEGPTPGVEITREAGDHTPTESTPADGVVAEQLVATRSASVHRLLLSPRARFAVAEGVALQPIAGELQVGGVAVPAHAVAPRGASVAEAGDGGATVLCVCRPARLAIGPAHATEGGASP